MQNHAKRCTVRACSRVTLAGLNQRDAVFLHYPIIDSSRSVTRMS